MKKIKENHLIINPHIKNYNEYELLKTFRMILIKFYRKYLGKDFNKKKDQQMKILLAPEYGELYEICKDEKHTHLHCIIQTENEDMLDKFHKWMKKELDAYFGKDIDYQYKVIDTPEYRTNCFNYVRKEGRTMFSNTDFYYKKSDTDKLF